mmetsp:Transcript_50687/g.115187  ORF Transcript_50687/g.115187 Transcript_50687/m.115187 type:complete len:420 (-) Transcript_50687:1409-2668(-)
MLQLSGDQSSIGASLLQQLIVGTFLHHHTAFHHHDTMSVFHRGQSVRDQQGSALSVHLLHQCVQCLLDKMLVLRVQGRSSLVQKQQSGPADQRPSNTDALLLAAAEILSALTHHGFVAFWQLIDELLRVRQPRRPDDILHGVLILLQSIRNVLLQSRALQLGILGDYSNAAPVLLEVQVGQILPINHHSTILGVVESKQKLREGRLSTPTLANHGNSLASLESEGNSLQNLLIGSGLIGELNVLQLDAECTLRTHNDANIFNNVRHQVDDLKYSLSCAHDLHGSVEVVVHRLESSRQSVPQIGESDDGSHLKLVVQYQLAPVEEHQERSTLLQDPRQQRRSTLSPSAFDTNLLGFLHMPPVGLQLNISGAMGTHCPHIAQRLRSTALRIADVAELVSPDSRGPLSIRAGDVSHGGQESE